MSDVERLAELRELFLTAPESWSTRVVAVVMSAALVAVVLWLVRRRTLREEYTPIWMGVALAVLAISLHRGLLLAFTRAIGAWTVSSTIFFFGMLFLLAICLHYAVRLSQLTLEVKNLSQQVALLRRDLEDVRPADAAPPPPAAGGVRS